MSHQDTKIAKFQTVARRGTCDETISVLAVGDTDEWLRPNRSIPNDDAIAFASFQEITPELLDRLSPSCVLSPALSHRFDCIELAQVLSQYGYRGRYRAISAELPRPELVEREVAQLCPTLNFAILVKN